jgi:hypothetical protein
MCVHIHNFLIALDLQLIILMVPPTIYTHTLQDGV